MGNLGVFLVVAAALVYLMGVLWAGIASLASNTPPQLPGAITASVTTIGGVLATHLGAVFGIDRINGARIFALRGPMGPPENPAPYTGLQRFAAWFYVICLAIAFIFWAIDGFSDQSAEVLKNLVLTFFGTLGGVLAVSLNVR